ncbi:polysaccharide pyruvyl transferase family protein [Sphingomonas sp. LM7]|uniref:polysaccharide pyruvyl transferase family protein n=1 Tax=Sphingomonas sp. LM7 TaxID=1938607 RepID=UPI000983BC52|nr:polysaccharide pyruvyl transferase family protein [Sphingomonas sp. LM7]AQR72320.1 hypothetical protein BXU08_00340 [Sphingomonas sp. LM7]
MEFGILRHDTDNLGDEIQTIAARQFMPRVHHLVSREMANRSISGTGPIKVIMNGWFMHHPRSWPPHPRIDPLFVSFHVTAAGGVRRLLTRTRPRDLILGRHLGYLKAHGPVGARDRDTLSALRAKGVDSYYSGCLTLTLPPRRAPRSDQVVAVDLSGPMLAELERRLGRKPVIVTHAIAADVAHDERARQAEALLDLYAGASCVVTTRLHCALPCLALGTPVLFVNKGDANARVEPALDLAWNCTQAQFLAGEDGYDPSNPPPNPETFRPLAAALRARCEAFISPGDS